MKTPAGRNRKTSASDPKEVDEMLVKKECVAMLLAGGQGKRLLPLTRKVAKPAVLYGSRYRIIDFPLSNCLNSGIDTVGVLTQYQPLELNDYLGNGDSWDMDLRFGGLHVLPPFQRESGADWYRGTADAIYQNLRFIERFDPSYVLILSGDHIYKMDYSLMLREHIKNRADGTIALIKVPRHEASRFGIMETDEDGRIIGFEEKPAQPKSTQASMGVYIFNRSLLTSYLTKDHADPASSHDFGKDIIPRMLGEGRRMFSYLFRGYWRDVGTLQSYWEANMDAIETRQGDPSFLNLNDPGWRIYYRHRHTHPQYAGPHAVIRNSIVGDGSEIDGSVSHSVIFSDVHIDKGAVVKDSLVLSGAHIERGAEVVNAIIDGETRVLAGQKIGGGKTGVDLTVISGQGGEDK